MSTATLTSSPAPRQSRAALLRRLSPRRLARRMRGRLRSRFERWLERKALDNPRFSALFYYVDGSFDRELHAVLAGKEVHARQLVDGDAAGAEAAEFTLRRNVHRLEKGLLMRPRRDVFAKAYVAETVDAYAVARHSADADLIRWATDVLDTYFEVVEAEGPIRPAADEYARLRSADVPVVEVGRRIPYLRETTPLPVSIDDLEALAHRRRSVRWFDSKAVPREAVDRALAVALQSPSACNRQPFTFRVFDDPDLAQRVAEVPMGTRGYVHNIPAIAVIVGRQRAYFSERDRHLIYVDGSLAAMSFMYALEVQGIGSCPINWPDIEEREREMSQLLGLAPDERPIMLVAFGYPDPDGAVAYSQKKPVQEARTYNDAPGATSE